MAATHLPFHRHHEASGVMLSGPGRAAAHAGTLGVTLEGGASTDLGDLVTYIENLAVGAAAKPRLVAIKGPPETLSIEGDALVSTAGTLEIRAYAGAVYSPYQNRIYFIPHNQALSSTWHYVDCTSGKVVPYTHGADGLVTRAYWGGVYDPVQNRIYFVPYKQAEQPYWHYINCDDGAVGAYDRPDNVHIDTMYMGGTYCHSQKRIYLAPYGNNGMYYHWHYIDTESCTAVSYVSGATPDTLSSEAYGGAVYSPTQQRTYFIPTSSQSGMPVWHYIDNTISDASDAVVAYTKTIIDVSVEDSDDSDDSDSDADELYPEQGGAFSATQNRIYFPPYSVDCSTPSHDSTPVINRLTHSSLRYTGVVADLATDRIYLIPKLVNGIYRYIDCKASAGGGYTIKKYTGWTSDAVDQWFGGAFSPKDGRIYLAPHISPQWGVIIAPSETAVDPRIAANPLFNGGI